MRLEAGNYRTTTTTYLSLMRSNSIGSRFLEPTEVECRVLAAGEAFTVPETTNGFYYASDAPPEAPATADDEGLLCGRRVQVDASGVGHCWRRAHADDIPAATREEIEGEILGGGRDECDDFAASNGQHYRWA